jgi:perosamine synthetase
MNRRKKDIRLNILSINSSLRDVLIALDRGVYGIIFIADEKERIVGIFTDGDVRRSLLSGAAIDTPVKDQMRTDFVYAQEGEPEEAYIKMLNRDIRHLPILSRNKKLVDFFSVAELWRLPVMEPTLGGNELKYLADCITSNWISSQGNYISRFENALSNYHGVPYALATSSGTTALHLALIAVGIGPGDEVIIPDLTFAATANTVIHAGAKPVMVDVKKDYWNIDPEKIEAALSERTKAIIPVHLYGHACDMDPIMDIAGKNSLCVIEDCAEALGARYKGKVVGSIGDLACFSFFSNKVITTGEGGMVITKSKNYRDVMEKWRDHGMSKNKRYWHDVPGFNYRMTNLQAAVGLAQMEQVDKFLENRRKISAWYRDGLSSTTDELTLPVQKKWADNIFWLYTILVNDQKIGFSRDDFMKALEREGIETRPMFYPLHLQTPYKCSGDFPVAEEISRKGVSLPTKNSMDEESVAEVCKAINKIIKNQQMMNSLKCFSS